MHKKKLMAEMEKYYGEDENRINHTRRVLSYAEKIMANSKNLDFDREIVVYTAILHDVGIPIAEEKYGSAVGKYQEREGPPIARNIMEGCNVAESVIKEVCEIIANHHSPGVIDTDNFKVFYDADWLVNLPAEYDLPENRKETKNIIDKIYFTEAAKEIARNEFIQE
ncbi:MAG: HD domain-containing protein [Halanaerobiales bacterium]